MSVVVDAVAIVVVDVVVVHGMVSMGVVVIGVIVEGVVVTGVIVEGVVEVMIGALILLQGVVKLDLVVLVNVLCVGELMAMNEECWRRNVVVGVGDGVSSGASNRSSSACRSSGSPATSVLVGMSMNGISISISMIG